LVNYSRIVASAILKLCLKTPIVPGIETNRFHPQSRLPAGKNHSFGSVANGRIKQWSDLDIAVIKNTKKRFYDRIGEVLQLIRPHQPVDVLVYTPKEYEQMKQDSWFVDEEVAKKGKTIYAV